MRRRAAAGGVTVQAIAGNHAVFLGLDLTTAARADCLGFSVHRTDHTENEQYWLSGFKTFRSVVPSPNPKQTYPSRMHPVQSFYWGDYTAKPAHRYTYRIVPRYGTPKNLVDRTGVEASVEITTNDPEAGVHGVYFNRGVAASQAYAARFGKRPDRLTEPRRTEAWQWLSRGLDEALLAFIRSGAEPGKGLRASVYEFTEPQVLEAFAAASTAGGDVHVIYHAVADDTGEGNEEAIAASPIDPAILTQRTLANLSHNKFIVRGTVDGQGGFTPEAVWTGSTNLSRGGIFGHANVGHLVRSPEIAAKYLAYWEEVRGDPDRDTLRAWVIEHSPFVPTDLEEPGIHTLFSPRSGTKPLEWYADQLARSTQTGHITLPFGLNAAFESRLTGSDSDALRFILLNKRDDHQDEWSADRRHVLVAVGSSGGPDSLSRWAKERLTGFNPRVPYLHTKILLVDPLTADPTVISGSANFSPASTNLNDENMLVVRGDTDLADVYFTEFARVFQHFYARWWASQLGGDTEDHGFLDETEGWQRPYFAANGIKSRLRRLYSSEVGANSP